ncbi:hypothetical protein [Pseudomonas cremoricolorata]|uniref:hypothetical protein n=1 Tax=Pseudomonas cremoricolorata TaxID=157783 RepID=UPI000405E3DE|nr:hypothetical protein [Pseudomonas cremoricolorata]
MISIRPLSFALALSLGLASTASFAATDMNNNGTATKPHSGQPMDHKDGTTAGHGTSTNAPGGTGSNDSADTGTTPNSTNANGQPVPKNNDGGTNKLPGTETPAKQ